MIQPSDTYKPPVPSHVMAFVLDGVRVDMRGLNVSAGPFTTGALDFIRRVAALAGGEIGGASSPTAGRPCLDCDVVGHGLYSFDGPFPLGRLSDVLARLGYLGFSSRSL